MTLATLIATYGYLAVFLGAVFEGETVLVLGGLASQEGYLSLSLVFLFAFLGAFVGDLSLFLLGKYRGERIINVYPRIKNRMVKPRKLIEKHRILIAFGMRFMYGFRHVIPFSLGMSSLPTRVFILWDAAGSIIWAIGIGFVGYEFGALLETFLGKIRHYEFKIIFFTILFLGAGFVFHRLMRYIIYKMNQE
ncbi:MAG: DedA family protein [Candidatus Taylorbacteria bacterium]